MSVRTWKEPGKGDRQAQGRHRRIRVGFDDDTFEEVRDLAKRSGVSFSEKARQLVEFGLMDVKEDGNGK